MGHIRARLIQALSTGRPRGGFRRLPAALLIVALALRLLSLSAPGAEIFIDRTGVRQWPVGNLNDGTMNDLRNDPVAEFNWYLERVDAQNPIEWTHQWDPATPSDGTIQLDADEVYTNMLAAEIFPLIWDIDYPISTEHDELYWDSVPYAGAGGVAFSMAANPAAIDLGRVEGNNATWGAKRISMNTALLAPGALEYFWLEIDRDPALPAWKTSIDYVDLAIIFNQGALSVAKSKQIVSGFDPPRVGYTSVYRVRVDISNPTLTSNGGPMYDVVVTDTFPAGSTISAAPTLGSAAITGAGALTWNVGILQDGALNAPPAAGSADFLEVLVSVTPTQAQVGVPITLNAGAQIDGNQVPEDPGDGTGTLYPFNFYSHVNNRTTAVSVLVATANVGAANTGALAVTPSVTPGQPITVTLTDADLNAAAGAVETYTLTLVNQATGESESLTLTETGANTGVFTATLATAFGAAAGANNSGSMNVQAGNVVRASYSDLVNAAGNLAAVTADTNVAGGATGVLSSPATAAPGDAIAFTLTDADLNANPAAADTKQLTAVNSRTGETETITLVETGVNTGVFTVSLNTAFGAAAGANNSAVMNCISGDTISAVYSDTLTAAGGTGSSTASTLVSGGSDGIITLTASALPGQTVTVSVADQDLNANAAAVETVVVTVANTTTGESESITLTETGANTGIFTGTAATAFGAAAGATGDGAINTTAGQNLVATYNDALTTAGGAATVTASTAITGGATATLTATASIYPGGAVALTLTDADLNTNAAAAEQKQITVTNTTTGESELVTLTETGANTGIFAGALATAYGAAAGVNNSGSMNASAGRTLRASYTDSLTAQGGQAALTADTAVLGGSTAVLTATASINPGSSIAVSLTEQDANTSAVSIQTVVLAAVNSVTGETETITLTETGVNTGVFTASVPTAYGAAAGTNNDGAFTASGGASINFTYNDARNADGGAAAVGASTLVVDDVNAVTITSPIGTFTTAVHDVVGTTDPLSRVTMRHPITGGLLTVNANAAGAYVFPSVTFPEGVTTYAVTSVDLVGNRASAAATVLIDTTNTITVTSPAPGSTTNQTTVRVTGTTDPNSTVTLVEPATGRVLTTTAAANGTFSFTAVQLSVGANVLPLTSTDPNGNVAAVNVLLTVDLQISLSITSVAESAAYNTSSHEIAGVTDPGAVLTMIHPTTGATLTTTADGADAYTFGSFAFPDGANTVTVSAVDPAGNTATTSAAFTVDTANTNTIITEGTFTTALVDVNGTTAPGAVVTMRHPLSGETLTTVADGAGAYVFDDVFLPDGSYTVRTISTDALGNQAADTSALVIDSTIKLSVVMPPDRSVVNTQTLDVTGNTDTFSTVTMFNPVTDEQLVTVADGNGDFIFADVELYPGSNTMTITAVDPVGNTATYDHTLIYDVDIPLVVSNPLNNSVVNNNVQNVTGTTLSGITVTMNDPVSGQVLTTTSGADGSFSFPNVVFPGGVNTVTVTAEDAFNNTTSTTIQFTVDAVGSDGALTASARAVMGQPIIIEVEDDDARLDPNVPDTLAVTVTNPANGDSETRTLVETSADSGVFTGRMDTVESVAPDGANSGVLTVQYGQTVTTTYVDVLRADGSLNTALQADTLITNDVVRINVNVTTSAGSGVAPLVNGDIAILEFDSGGKLTGAALNFTTNGQGDVPTEFIGHMKRGNEYRILMDETLNGFPYSHSEEFTLGDIELITADARGVRTMVILLDPAGYVYDAVTGARVAGADVTLWHEDGTRVAGAFSFFTRRPSERQTNPQLSGDSGDAGGFEFIAGDAASDLTAGNYYITVTFASNPALGAVYSQVLPTPGAWSGIAQPYEGQVFRVDRDNQPIGMRVPLYSTSGQPALSITKVANKKRASVGDVITFAVTVRNPGAAPTDPGNPVVINDTLPPGLAYVRGSAVDSSGNPVAAAISAGGAVSFDIGRLEAAGDPAGLDTVTIFYQAAVDTSVSPGYSLTNTASAGINGTTLSNTSAASVLVVEEPMFDLATIIGRVFDDSNGNGVMDRGERGIEGAGVALDDGTYVVTGPDGKYSLPGVTPGLTNSWIRVVKLDHTSLAAGGRPTTPLAVFVSARPGGVDKANFGVRYGDFYSAPAHPRGERPDRLFVAMFDAALGELKADSGDSRRNDRDALRDGRLKKARGAWFFKGAMGPKFSLTAAFDSNKRHTTEISRDNDRDLYYPTYGDGSRISRFAESRNRFYMNLKSPNTRLLLGNFEAGFDGAELAGTHRTLSGGLFDFRQKTLRSNGENAGGLTIFASRRRQLSARTDLRASGGAHYHLAHSDVIPGSERITVEVRDALAPERVLASRPAKRDDDYEIDYKSGAVKFRVPPETTVESLALVQRGAGEENPVWIVAEYTYEPGGGNDYGTLGGRFFRWGDYGLGAGASFLRENYRGRDHLLKAFDLHWKPENEELFKFEYARTESAGAPWYASVDAGRSFVNLGGRHSDSGVAMKMDFKSGRFGDLVWKGHYSQVGENFAGAYSGRGVRRLSTRFEYARGADEWSLDVSRAASMKSAGQAGLFSSSGGKSRDARLGWKRKFDTGSITAEFSHERNGDGAAAFGGDRGTRDDFITRYERKITSRLLVAVSQQVSFAPAGEHQSVLSARYEFKKDAFVAAEGAFGPGGAGGRLMFSKKKSGGASVWTRFATGWSRETRADTTSFAAGASGRVFDNTKAYVESESLTGGREHTSRRTLGVETEVDVESVLKMTLGAERREETSSLQGRYFTNALNWSASYAGFERMKVVSDAQFRRQRGAIDKSFMEFRLMLDGEMTPGLFTFAEYEWDSAFNRKTRANESKYTKAVAGFAYRPARHDRLNLLTKAGRIRDFRSPAVNETMNPDTITSVLSLEGVYDAGARLTLRGKTAAKFIKETISPLPPARTRTALYIAGAKWRPAGAWDMAADYRVMTQATGMNHRDGASVECGWTYREKVRAGVGWNFSSWSDDEFAALDHSYEGFFIRLQGKF